MMMIFATLHVDPRTGLPRPDWFRTWPTAPNRLLQLLGSVVALGLLYWIMR